MIRLLAIRALALSYVISLTLPSRGTDAGSAHSYARHAIAPCVGSGLIGGDDSEGEHAGHRKEYQVRAG